MVWNKSFNTTIQKIRKKPMSFLKWWQNNQPEPEALQLSSTRGGGFCLSRRGFNRPGNTVSLKRSIDRRYTHSI
jgi:hypothetical protein